MLRNGLTEKQAIEARKRYVEAWNRTMITMWQEQVTLLQVIDTGTLLSSLSPLPLKDLDSRYQVFTISQQFREYGIWQEYGVGKEVARGNPGDIGRTKVRQRRPWFSRKYYQSVRNICDFMAESIGEEFIGIVSDAMYNDTLRNITEYNRRNKH